MKRVERREIALDQRLRSGDVRFLVRKEPPSLGDLRADEKAGEIFTRVVLGELAHERQAAGAKKGGEKPGSFPAAGRRAAPDAERKGEAGRLPFRVASEGARERVVPDRSEQFAGHECLEALDAASFHDRPFRVRAGQDDQPPARVRDAENLDLFAAHHVGLAIFVLIRQAGGEMNDASPRLHRDDTGGDVAPVGGTFHVRRLAPAVPAADHAGGDDRQIVMRVEPAADETPERLGKAAWGDGRDAVGGCDFIDERAVARHQIGAEAR